MAGGLLDYPPEIVDAVVTMQRAATQLNTEMADLKAIVENLVSSSKAETMLVYNDLQREWDQSGLAHNQTLEFVAKAAGESYDEITAFDAHLARTLGA